MTPAEVLAAHGIVRAAEVVELAAVPHLELACAAVLLEKESGGGRNVWGHDDVPTGGAYDTGGVVTRANYAAYKAALGSGAARRQGVGPCQLTWGPYQDQADAEGGCWDWRTNIAVGFRILASLIHDNGERDGFRAYNGTGPAAERYADDAMTRLASWRALLAAATPPEDDVPLTDDEIERIARRTADLTWQRPTANAFGDVVEGQQIIATTEKRVADLADRVAGLALPNLVDSAGRPMIDLDALAERVLDRLAHRLGSA